MLCRVLLLAASIAILGGCAMKAPHLAATSGGTLTDLGPNSPWYPDHDWLTPESQEIAGSDGLAELLEDRRVVTRAAELARERRKSLGQALARSGPYRLMVHRELQAQGVPIELASVPLVESGWIPNALGRWVAGLWQFTSDTARAYGLTVDHRTDQRRDPERSTRAAASYLRDLYDRFGRWDLALAGYNAGPARVEQALRRRPGATFFELSEGGLLPETTRRYVPEVLATALLSANPERFGIEGIETLRAARFGRLWSPFG
jgi:hypothetical protein